MELVDYINQADLLYDKPFNMIFDNNVMNQFA